MRDWRVFSLRATTWMMQEPTQLALASPRPRRSTSGLSVCTLVAAVCSFEEEEEPGPLCFLPPRCANSAEELVEVTVGSPTNGSFKLRLSPPRKCTASYDDHDHDEDNDDDSCSPSALSAPE